MDFPNIHTLSVLEGTTFLLLIIFLCHLKYFFLGVQANVCYVSQENSLNKIKTLVFSNFILLILVYTEVVYYLWD